MRRISIVVGVLGLALAGAGFRSGLGGELDDEIDGGPEEDAAAPLDATIDVDPEPGEPIDHDDAS